MGVLSELRKRWFVTGMCVASTLFFTGALLFSTLTYVDTMEARQGVELRNAVETAEELDNGSLLVSLSIEVYNPSGRDLVVQSLSWTVRVNNSTESSVSHLMVASAYNSTSDDISFPGESVRPVMYEAIVSDPVILAALREFINLSESQGDEYTLSTVPYLHDFRLVAWMDGFDHDYQYYKELYLNDMVRVERRYFEGEYL